MALAIGKRSALDAMAWKGVLDVEDPYAVPPKYLLRARNIYLPNPGSGCGVYGRPGFLIANSTHRLGADGARIGQAATIATIADGTPLNFLVVGGKLYRVSSDFSTYTDVTPVGITIDANARVHLTPFSNRLLVNDDVNTPWVADDLTSTPVTGTTIQYSGVGVAWRAYGPAVIYDDAAVWIVRVRDGISTGSRIAWSEPDDPFTGYFQPNFDNEWDVVQNGGEPIFALFPTNLALYYFRNDFIGYLSGTIGDDFKTTATKDAIDGAIGTRTPASLISYNNRVYFIDVEGKPYRLTIGGGLEELWQQMRRPITTAPTRWVDKTARVSCAALVPELDLYVVAMWSAEPDQTAHQFPTTLYAFHAPTGRYVGEWTIGPGIAVQTIGVLSGVDGQRVLAVLGTNGAAAVPQAAGDGGYLWLMNTLGDGQWTDAGALPDLLARTPPLGFDADTQLHVDGCVAVVQEVQTDIVPRSLVVDPIEITLGPGETADISAILRNRAGGLVFRDIDVWSSSAPTKATVAKNGSQSAIITGVGTIGSTLITCALTTGLGAPLASSNSCLVHCINRDPVPVTLEIVPAEVTLTLAAPTCAFTAIARNAAGQEIDMVPDLWTSDNTPAVAVGSTTGIASAVSGPSTAHIQAFITAPPVASNLALVHVTPGAPATLVIPSTLALEQAETEPLAPTVRDANGTLITNIAPDVWTSSTPATATVDLTGHVLGVAATGTTNVQAKITIGVGSPVLSNLCAVTVLTHFVIHTFTASGSFIVSAGAGTVEALIVAGGGSGGSVDGTSAAAGGGGAGGLIHLAAQAVAVGSYPIARGDGGIAPHADHTLGSGSFGVVTGLNGTDSSAFGQTAIGGGGGGGASGAIARQGRAGGSGGGGGSAGDLSPGAHDYDGGAGTVGQGHNGGTGSNSETGPGAGGGGAGGVGSLGTGGVGAQYDISNVTGTLVTYAVGGGAVNGGAGVAGTSNRGNGGSGGGQSLLADGGNGGSGIIILKYRVNTGIVATGGTRVVLP